LSRSLPAAKFEARLGWGFQEIWGKRTRMPGDRDEDCRAVTIWSAIAAGAYIGQLHMPPNYDPRHDDWLSERMVANLSETFAEVMGEAPWQEDE
jgi:hypothetical protein